MSAKTKLASWEDSWAQAKRACDAWRKEAEDSAEKARLAEQEKLQEVLKKDEVCFSFIKSTHSPVAVCCVYMYMKYFRQFALKELQFFDMV